MLLSEGQMSDYKRAALMLDAMPDAPVLMADRGYDADWPRQALRARGTRPCIPVEPDAPGRFDTTNISIASAKVEIMFR